MFFLIGLITGIFIGFVSYKYKYTLECNKNEIICNQQEKDKEIQRQLERLIAYGNDK